jgi:hypothetical protein
LKVKFYQKHFIPLFWNIFFHYWYESGEVVYLYFSLPWYFPEHFFPFCCCLWIEQIYKKSLHENIFSKVQIKVLKNKMWRVKGWVDGIYAKSCEMTRFNFLILPCSAAQQSCVRGSQQFWHTIIKEISNIWNESHYKHVIWTNSNVWNVASSHMKNEKERVHLILEKSDWKLIYLNKNWSIIKSDTNVDCFLCHGYELCLWHNSE